ncbi:MAG: ABC transporter permease [bacterium]|nr:ABC transporter permease [bacterium]
MIKRLFCNKMVLFGGSIVMIFVVVAICCPLLSPYDPYQVNLCERLQPPDKEHLCGTDNIGRDVLSRIIYGTRVSLAIGVIATLISMIFGLFFGVISGYFGGYIDKIVLCLIDIMLAFPGLLLAIGIAVAIGPGLLTLFMALSIVGWAGFARMVRGVVIAAKEQAYVEAARAIGVSDMGIIIRHILPNCLSMVIVLSTLKIGSFILGEAALSFLGLGAQPPTPTWGSMVSTGFVFLRSAPWISIIPGLTIAVVVIGFNLFGDGLRDTFDPKLREKTD